MNPVDEANLRSAARAFESRHDTHLCGGMDPVNLFGFGTVPAMFADERGDWWCTLFDLAGPTAVDQQLLLGYFLEQTEQDGGCDDADTLAWQSSDGEDTKVYLVKCSFAMRVLMHFSPWSQEFLENSADMLRHAMLRSGLADAFGSVAEIQPDGTVVQTGKTFAEIIAADLPPEQDATDAAFAGPRLAH